MQGLLKETQQANDRLQKEYNLLTEKVSKMQHTLEEHIHTNTQVGKEEVKSWPLHAASFFMPLSRCAKCTAPELRVSGMLMRKWAGCAVASRELTAAA